MKTDLHEPLISAVMIVYNGEAYIDSAIESVLNQTYKNFELLILNDGSNDLTEQKVSFWVSKDHRVKYFRNETNKGLSYSRNKIINLSNGDYIAVTDADDVNLPNRFKTQIEILKQDSNLHILGSWVKMINGNGEEQYLWDYPLSDKDIKEGLKSSCVVANPSSMFKKEVFEKIKGYNEDLTFCEDWDFFYRAIPDFNFKNLAEPLILYRVHGSNMSKKKLEETITFSLYLSNGLDKSCLSYNINKMVLAHPELIDEIIIKIIKFYTFWIEIYCKLGYKKLGKELYMEVLNNFLSFFKKSDKKLFFQKNINIALKNFNFEMLTLSLKNYLID